MHATNPLHPIAPRVLVRYGFSEFDTWRETLPQTRLLAMATYGALDAPDNLAAGATKGDNHGGSIGRVTVRAGAYF